MIRRGEVTAVRSNTSWTWTSESGETMQGDVGDWRVTDESGRSWSVKAKILPAPMSMSKVIVGGGQAAPGRVQPYPVR